MLAGSARGLRGESTTAAATALVVLLTGMADRLHERDDGDAVDDWVERTRDPDHEIDAAWATVRDGRGRRRAAGARRRPPSRPQLTIGLPSGNPFPPVASDAVLRNR
jgi:hypothetical protein